MSEVRYNELGAPIDEPDPPMGPQAPLIGDDQLIMRVAFALGVVLFLWKLYIGLIANVIWEEGHFVVSGQYLALGYPDIPAGFPWLARLITTIFGWSIVPLRLVALVIATGIPFAVYFMAKPIVSQRNALWAAILAMLLPPISMNGTIFYPEGALQLLLALMLGCLIRAIDDPDKLKWWLWTGACAAIGLLVHFRFLVPGLAVVIYLAANAKGRQLWTKPGIYITAAIGFLGLLPSVIYNATHGWPAILFHVVNRPHFVANPKYIISFVQEQFGLVTPVFFIALVWACKISIGNDKDKSSAVLGYQSAVIFAFYCLQALINKKVMPHWPFMSYVPVLPYVPILLSNFADAATKPLTRRIRMGLIATGPVMALCVGIVISVYEYDFVHSAQLSYNQRGINFMKNENWTALEPDLAAANARAVQRFGPNIVWAADGHIEAVRLEFPGVKGRRVFTLDEPYDEQSRFVVARHDWGLDLLSLQKRPGQGVLLALEEQSYVYHDPVELRFYEKLCEDFQDIEPYKISVLLPGKTAVNLFTARVRSTPLTDADLAKTPCLLMPQLYIAHPNRGEFITVHNSDQYFGIAADPLGIKSADILLDGKVATPVKYGIDDPNFHAPAVLRYDPNWPKVQFTYSFPPGSLKPGQHILSLRATRSDGTTFDSAPRTLYVTKKGGPQAFIGG